MPLYFDSPIISISSYITNASFRIPKSLGSITIENINGNFTSFKVLRTGGTQGNFSSNMIYSPANSYTDPTVLSDGIKYTYIITPYDSNGNPGPIFTQTYNPSINTYNGKISTLANPLLASPTLINANGSTSSVYLSWTNNGYSNITIQNTTINGQITSYTSASNITTYNSSGIDILSTNTIYNYTFFVSNEDGILNPNGTTLTTCTWGIINTINHSNPVNNSIILNCTGYFNGVYITYTGGTANPISGTTINTANNITTNFSSMDSTSYTYTCSPINLLNYKSNNNSILSININALLIYYKFLTSNIYNTIYLYNWASGSASITANAIADNVSPVPTPYIQTNQYITINNATGATTSSVYQVNGTLGRGKYTITLNTGYSYSFWYFPIANSTGWIFNMESNSVINGTSSSLTYNNNNNIVASIYDYWISPGINGPAYIYINSWNLITRTVDPFIRKASLYINGTLSSSTSAIGSFNNITTNRFGIGYGTSYSATGYYQDFRFYNYPLSTTEISGNDLYNTKNISTLSITSWTTTGIVTPTKNNGISPFTYFDVSGVSGGSYAYTSPGVGSLLGKSISFNAYLVSGNPSFYYACNSSGSGQMLQFGTLNNNSSGLATSTTWTNKNSPTVAYTWALNRWWTVTININSSGLAKWSGNGVYSGDSLNISNNGDYIGISCDSTSRIYIQNLRVHNFEHSMV